VFTTVSFTLLPFPLLPFLYYCCNLSGGVALIVWFTTNGMCVKNNTIIYVARASNRKRDCDVVALPILTCERLNLLTSVREERLRAWSLLLLAATVRSFAHVPLGISDRNTTAPLLYFLSFTTVPFPFLPLLPFPLLPYENDLQNTDYHPYSNIRPGILQEWNWEINAFSRTHC